MAQEVFNIVQAQYIGTNIEKFLLNLEKVLKKHVKDVVDSFCVDIYDLKTAKGIGLDVWGEILNFPRVIRGYLDTDDYITLSDDEYRTILGIKALQMTTNETIPAMNRDLKRLFTDTYNVYAYVDDNQDMSIVNYVFLWAIPDWLKSAFTHYDLLPHPMGVGTGFTEALAMPIGFDGQGADEVTNFYRAKYMLQSSEIALYIGFDGQNQSNFYNAIFKN